MVKATQSIATLINFLSDNVDSLRPPADDVDRPPNPAVDKLVARLRRKLESKMGDLKMGKVKLREVFREIDVNGDGQLDQHELFNGLNKMKLGFSFAEIGIIYNYYDDDGSGTTSYDEFLNIINYKPPFDLEALKQFETLTAQVLNQNTNNTHLIRLFKGHGWDGKAFHAIDSSSVDFDLLLRRLTNLYLSTNENAIKRTVVTQEQELGSMISFIPDITFLHLRKSMIESSDGKVGFEVKSTSFKGMLKYLA